MKTCILFGILIILSTSPVAAQDNDHSVGQRRRRAIHPINNKLDAHRSFCHSGTNLFLSQRVGASTGCRYAGQCVKNRSASGSTGYSAEQPVRASYRKDPVGFSAVVVTIHCIDHCNHRSGKPSFAGNGRTDGRTRCHPAQLVRIGFS